MTDFKATNKTKFDAGGSGDNVVPDGYIKTVEKIWKDAFAFTAVLTSADTVNIGTIPKNKKVGLIEVYFPSLTPTDCTIQVGTASEPGKFISSASTAGLNVVRSNLDTGIDYVTTAVTDIILSIGKKAITAPTAGTIKTIVRYT